MKNTKLMISKTKTYLPANREIMAIEYEDDQRLAMDIQEYSNGYAYCEFDECGKFIGLRAHYEPGNHRTKYVEDGDYLIYYQESFLLMDRDEFKTKYSPLFDDDIPIEIIDIMERNRKKKNARLETIRHRKITKPKTAEQILKEYEVQMVDVNMDECIVIYRLDALSAMEEYLNQYKKPRQTTAISPTKSRPLTAL